MSNIATNVSCLLIPVQDRLLLLPNTSVAEIVDYQQPEQNGGALPWFLGFADWRGLRLPLISYEGANERDATFDPDTARIAVTNCIGPHAKEQPFIAFLTTGLPRLAKVTPGDIQERETGDCGSADQMAITWRETEAYIPSLESLEELAWQANQEF